MADFRTSGIVIALRNFLRQFGITKLIGWILSGQDYEDSFSNSLLAAIRVDDCIWDVGANVGFYATQFAERAPEGKIIAFEPTQKCVTELRKNTSSFVNVEIQDVALGDRDAEVRMELARDELGATHRILDADSAVSGTVSVQQRSAQSFLSEYPDWFPNFIKIDVEGFEGEVLDGMSSILADRRLRFIGIEVHFGLLASRGRSDRPRLIVDTLETAGFRVSWVDSSHVTASR